MHPTSDRSRHCRLELWKGKVRLEFLLLEADVTISAQTDPVMVLASRYSYLPIIAEDVIRSFQQRTIEFSSDIWFEDTTGIALKSHIPLGVLYDRYRLAAGCDEPWRIYIRFQRFPVTSLLKCSTPKDSQRFFFHSLKQALYLLHGSTRMFNDLTIENQRSIWNAIQISVNEDFMEAGVVSELEPINVDDFHSIPIRLTTGQQQTYIQRPVTPGKGSKAMKSIADVLTSDFGVDSGLLSSEKETVKKRLSETEHSCRHIGMALYAQGVPVPLEAPVIDVWRLMRHCDLFLYIHLR